MARHRRGVASCCYRRRDQPNLTGTHGQLAGRLAVVFRNRLFVRILDDHWSRSDCFFRRLRDYGDNPLDKWVTRVYLRPTPVGAVPRIRVETQRPPDASESVQIDTPLVTVAHRHRLRRFYFCRAYRLGRAEQLVCLPRVSLWRAVWRERPAFRKTTYRILSLFFTRLRHHQKLDVAHALPERALCRSGLLAVRRHRV